jgi:hypothetical protein
MPSRNAYNLGSLRGFGSSTRIYNFCRQTSPTPWTCIDQFTENAPQPPPPPPSPGKMKTVFLLELTAGYTENDIPMKNTLEYYWNTYSQEFINCPVVDTQGSLNVTLDLLDEYYNYGFRNFVGFSRSTIVNGVLDWFNLHSNAIGISATSTDPTLNIPKQIFRMTPSDNYVIDSIQSFLKDKTVNYIYSSNENAPTNLIPNIQSIQGISLNLIPITSTSDFNTTEFINTVNSFPNTDIILFYVLTGRENYISLFSTSGPITFTGQQYDILGIVAPNIESVTLENKYNIVTFKGIETSIIWRNGYIDLTSNNFSIVSLNILNLLNTLLNNSSLENINSYFGILQFDPVTKDLLYPNFLIETFTGNNTFTNTNLFLKDPILGEYNATFTNPSPIISNIPTPSYTPYGKPIALLELTNYSNNIDTIYNDSLYYYWYKNPNFPKFPIIDTGSSIPNTLTLLDTYYSEGYRIFLGFSRSTVLTEVIGWFNSHPDAVGISLWSTAISLNTVPRNIYRTTPSDDTLVDAVIPYLPTDVVGNVYYIYTGGELATEDVLLQLQSIQDINLLTYPVGSGYNPLTVTDLQTFFSGSTSNDVVVLYLLDEQPYFDLYAESPPLTFPGKQYDIINTQLPLINGVAQNELNNKLYYIQNTYPNTALLWRENAEYLTVKAGGDLTSSTGLANALTMIDYFQKGKNIGLLGSYSAVLQFNQYKDIEFPSFLFRLYKSATNTFVQNSISFDDPLLGSFQADFI